MLRLMNGVDHIEAFTSQGETFSFSYFVQKNSHAHSLRYGKWFTQDVVWIVSPYILGYSTRIDFLPLIQQ